jgi:hypothetical protein
MGDPDAHEHLRAGCRLRQALRVVTLSNPTENLRDVDACSFFTVAVQKTRA